MDDFYLYLLRLVLKHNCNIRYQVSLGCWVIDIPDLTFMRISTAIPVHLGITRTDDQNTIREAIRNYLSKYNHEDNDE